MRGGPLNPRPSSLGSKTRTRGASRATASTTPGISAMAVAIGRKSSVWGILIAALGLGMVFAFVDGGYFEAAGMENILAEKENSIQRIAGALSAAGLGVVRLDDLETAAIRNA